jgi:1-acyl-sn-glycerol-3-phosphate acyltransferase
MSEPAVQSSVPAAPGEVRPVPGAPEASPGTRLWFLWFAVVAVLATFPFSFLQVVTHRFRPTARNFKTWAGRWGAAILGCTAIRVVVEERARLDPEGPYVFVANHQNTLDILALAAGLPYAFGFVAKGELARVPALGFALRHSASVFLDRSDRRSALESMQRAGQRIRDGMSVLIFPEGERTYSPALRSLKKGAFYVALEAGVPLVPVTVVNAYRFLDERRHVGRPGTLRLVVGRPIDLAGKHRRDLPEIMEAVRAQLDAELGVERSYVEREHAGAGNDNAVHL